MDTEKIHMKSQPEVIGILEQKNQDNKDDCTSDKK